MKRFYSIITLVAALFAGMPLQAQETGTQTPRKGPRASRGERIEKQENNGLPELTVRAQDMNDRLTQELGNARWMRVIYREVDLTKAQNAPLYYPVHPMNGQMNLFSIIGELQGFAGSFLYFVRGSGGKGRNRADVRNQ